MPITVPVPKEYAKKFDAKPPSKYDQYVAFTGPYMVKNDPKTASSIGRVPGKSIDLVRNPNWDKSTDYRPAYLDEIKIEEGNDDLATASRRALNGTGSVCCDAGSPPAPVLKQVVQTRTRTRCCSCRRAARATSRSTPRSSRSTTSTSARRSSRPPTATPCA